MKIKITSLAHYLGGSIAAALTLVVPTLAVLLTALFVIYEMDEKWTISDESFVDLKEYLVGMFFISPFVLVIRF
ncbi:MAG: hypothetical protein HYU02_02075 [Thaumarchaeota archaeon]|nr:hypothetical protein [Nitrososphaerota archaeon]